jgi:hypothetical protein
MDGTLLGGIMLRFIPLISLVALLVACKNPNYCAGVLNDDCRLKLDAPGPGTCSGDADCADPTAVCDLTGTMMCVQCTASESQACTNETPVCGDDHMCRACSAHADCPTSLACLPDGFCGTDANVAYVDPMGTDNAACTKMTPCTKFSKALAANKLYVKFTGTTNEAAESGMPAVSINSQKVTLLADPGAKLTNTKNGLLLEVTGTSQVAIYDLEITGASGMTGVGISLPTGNMAELDLHRVKITNNQGGGISASGGMLTIAQSVINGNQGIGISSSANPLSMSQSEVSENNAGGLQMTADGMVTLINNIAHHNGNDTSASFGAFSLRPSLGSMVQFNTIVDNKANMGAASTGGVFCDIAGFVAANNLIFRNTGGSPSAQTFGNCTYGDSFVAAGSSTADNTPQFVHPNTLPFDYHLTSTTPATILDAAGACSGVDFDGDSRPIGPACDLGADEYHP